MLLQNVIWTWIDCFNQFASKFAKLHSQWSNVSYVHCTCVVCASVVTRYSLLLQRWMKLHWSWSRTRSLTLNWRVHLQQQDRSKWLPVASKSAACIWVFGWCPFLMCHWQSGCLWANIDKSLIKKLKYALTCSPQKLATSCSSQCTDKMSDTVSKHKNNFSCVVISRLRSLKGTKREILSAMHVKELIQSNHSER